METRRETIERTIKNLATDFQGFINSEIGSAAYIAFGIELEVQIETLARLHPRWSAEHETILPWCVGQAQPDADEDDPMFCVYQYGECLFHLWNEMITASKPSTSSLIEWVGQMSYTVAVLNKGVQ